MGQSIILTRSFSGRAAGDLADKAIALLSVLPVLREPGDPEILRRALRIALEGPDDVLVEATEAILRGSLGHAFQPSPPELRQQCDRIAFERRMLALAEKLPEPVRQEPPKALEPPKPSQPTAFLQNWKREHDDD